MSETVQSFPFPFVHHGAALAKGVANGRLLVALERPETEDVRNAIGEPIVALVGRGMLWPTPFLGELSEQPKAWPQHVTRFAKKSGATKDRADRLFAAELERAARDAHARAPLLLFQGPTPVRKIEGSAWHAWSERQCASDVPWRLLELFASTLPTDDDGLRAHLETLAHYVFLGVTASLLRVGFKRGAANQRALVSSLVDAVQARLGAGDAASRNLLGHVGWLMPGAFSDAELLDRVATALKAVDDGGRASALEHQNVLLIETLERLTKKLGRVLDPEHHALMRRLRALEAEGIAEALADHPGDFDASDVARVRRERS